MSEMLENGADDERAGSVATDVTSAQALAVVAFVLATFSLFGVALLNGATYIRPEAKGGQDYNGTALLPETLLGAAIAALIVVLASVAWTRARVESAQWSEKLAAAAGLIAMVSLVGRLVVALLEATGHGSFNGF
jgi:hypothetical protein